MIKTPRYRKRELEFLEDRLRSFLNKLNMRDWSITLILGDELPAEFSGDDEGSCGYINYDDGNLTGTIWICPVRCRQNKIDPLFVLKHEVCHAFLDSHNDEVRTNVVASLL